MVAMMTYVMATTMMTLSRMICFVAAMNDNDQKYFVFMMMNMRVKWSV